MDGTRLQSMDSSRSIERESKEDAGALIEQLEQDRAWLLEQIDRGRWAEFRLDLAALERELGQLLQRASEYFTPGAAQH